MFQTFGISSHLTRLALLGTLSPAFAAERESRQE